MACEGLTGEELRRCLILQYGAAVDGMCNGNLINMAEAVALKEIANGLAMKRVPGKDNGLLAGTDDDQGGAA